MIRCNIFKGKIRNDNFVNAGRDAQPRFDEGVVLDRGNTGTQFSSELLLMFAVVVIVVFVFSCCYYLCIWLLLCSSLLLLLFILLLFRFSLLPL
jgi:hypothetical protein